MPADGPEASSSNRKRHEPGSPSSWVRRFLGRAETSGTLLDLAAGGGRHSRLAAALGFRVTAVDRDVSELRTIPGIEVIAADLEDGSRWPLAERRFAAVVVTNYLHRPLLPRIVGAVAPGGLLVYETFALGNERFGHPRNPAFLLRPGELLDAVRGDLTVLAYEHGAVDDPSPAVVQRLAAVRGDPAPSV
jgi:SAM-dependent methyltransferase